MADRGPLMKKEHKKVFKVHEQISPCEKTIMGAFKELDRKTKMIESNLLSSKQLTVTESGSPQNLVRSVKPPLNSTVEKLDLATNSVRPDRLTEWEKSHFEKIFKSLDDFAKTKTIKRDSLKKLFDVMEKDETYLGKIPVINKEEILEKVALRMKDKKELSYLTFRLLLDDFGWRTLTKAESKSRVDALYETANTLLREGKSKEAINECANALSLSRYH